LRAADLVTTTKEADPKEERLMTTTEELARQHVDHEVIAHRRTETALDEAAAVGVPGDEVAKTVVLVSEAGFVRAVVPASKRVDLGAVRRLFDDETVRLASETEVTYAYPLCELGAVSPFAGPGGDRIVVDPHVLAQGSIVFESGSQRQSIRMRAVDLVELSHAWVAPICCPGVNRDLT
jgi:Ala-tRNA(Pro) deacylase